MVFWVCIFTLPAMARSERPDLNGFTDAQRKEMCELLDEWTTAWLIDMHGNDFGKMHQTNDYLRWHRDHFKHLEHFLLKKGKTQYIPFPKWNPANPIPSYFNGFEADGVTPYNNISSKCLGGLANGCRSREDYSPGGAFEFNQTGVFDGTNVASGFTQDNLPLPTFYDNNGTLCTVSAWNNINSYSNHSQIRYHNAGHVAFDGPTQQSVMGSMAPNRAAAVYIFWAWHAHIDDMWWQWDVCKKVNTNAYTYGNGLTIASGTTVTWDDPTTPIKIQGNLVIEENATLIIKDGQVVEMLDEYFTDQSCDIIVNKGSSGTAGGRLQIESGAVIRGIVAMGSDNGTRSTSRTVVGFDANGDPIFEEIYLDARVYYLCKWSGIKVYGDPTKSTQAIEHGKVIVDGSASEVLFQYSKSAIESVDGGVIQCTNAIFRNCDNAINIHSYTDPNPTKELESFLTDCTFEQLDQISRYVKNDNMYMHDLHDYQHLIMVKLQDVIGMHVAGCNFINSDPNVFEYGNRGVGLRCFSSKVYVHRSGNQTENPVTKCPTFDGDICSFSGLSYGIQLSYWQGPPTVQGDVGIDESVFTDCFTSIYASHQERVAVYNCKFNYDEGVALFPSATTADPQRFVLLSDNWYNIVHGSAMLLDPMDPNSPKIYQSVMNTNSPIATLVEINGSSYKSLNNKVMQNEFVNTSPSPLSYGLLLKNDNFNSTITCNRFQGFNGAIYNLGKLRNQEGREQGNDFADPIGTPEQHIRTDNTPVTAFRYETAQTLDVSINVTVTPPSGSEEPICNLNCESDIASIKETDKIGMLVVYPNPSNGVYNVHIDKKYKLNELSIRVIDNIGRVVYDEVPSGYTQKISISNASGIYYLELSNKNQIVGRAKLIAYE